MFIIKVEGSRATVYLGGGYGLLNLIFLIIVFYFFYILRKVLLRFRIYNIVLFVGIILLFIGVISIASYSIFSSY